MRCHISVHDVMPSTLDAVDSVLSFLSERRVKTTTLLVVPGRDWRQSDIRRLAAYQQAGHQLAGHGWKHKARHVRGLRHRTHSLMFSRDVAEHLALDELGISVLLRKCHAWFTEHGLRPPTLYVPPAWAMGPIQKADLYALPFRFFETLGGVYDAETNLYSTSPCTGYEADVAWRTPALKMWNKLCLIRAARTDKLRISIHPHDLQLQLRNDLDEHIRRFAIHQQTAPV